ncbi:MAG: tetratricopeptide repeat protein [Desulfobacteraceae bacterium]|jgi:tetratricopeptide (TPR) repeat protein|nr:tetratricopeptide repeat protein [Desulfobacteraceae bacterium]
MTENREIRPQDAVAEHPFLRSPTDSQPMAPPRSQAGKITCAVPGMLCGQAFLDESEAFTRPLQAFAAVAIRMDDAGTSDTAMAESMEDACRETDGVWGKIEDGLFGCLLADADADKAVAVVEGIRHRLFEAAGIRISFGVAMFPTIDYSRADIMDNARKALEHAAFFGPGSNVIFDAVSLNISGDQLYQQGDMQGAVDEFHRALELDPRNVNVHNSLGVCHGVMGEWDRALERFETVLQIDPGEVMAIYNLGLVHLLGEDDKPRALERFLEAARGDDSIFEIQLETGKLYLEMDRTEDALGFLEKAASLNPQSSLAQRYLGECFERMEDAHGAVAAYQKAVKCNPNDAASLSALGVLMDAQGENAEITTAFCRHSVEIAPDNGLYHLRLARLYEKHDRPEAAAAAFEKALALGCDLEAEAAACREGKEADRPQTAAEES